MNRFSGTCLHFANKEFFYAVKPIWGHSGLYLSTFCSVCLDGSEVSNKEVSPWTVNPSMNKGAAERKWAAPCPVGMGSPGP